MYVFHRYTVLHMPVGTAIECAIVRRFPKPIALRVSISNPKQSSGKQINHNFTPWSERFYDGKCWWIRYRLSWQISRLTFTCKQVQFKWLCLLDPANVVGVSSNFSSINDLSDQNLCTDIILRDICVNVQLIQKQIFHPYICNGFVTFTCQLSHAMLFQWGLDYRKSVVRPASVAPANVWRTV